MDLSAALAELSATADLAAQIPDGLKLLRAALGRLATTARALGDQRIADEAELLAREEDELPRLLEHARALAAGEPPDVRAAAAPGAEPMSSEDDGLIELLVQSMGEAATSAEELLLALEADPYDQGNVSELRRIVHTVKGEAGVLGLDATQTICHDSEEMIERCLDAGHFAPAVEPLLGLVDFLRRYADAIRVEGAQAVPPASGPLRERIAATRPGADDQDWAHAADGTSPETPAPGRDTGDRPVQLVADALVDDTLHDFIDEARHHLESIEADLLEFEARPNDGELLNRIFRAFHTIKGVAGFLNLAPIVRLTHTTETLLDRLRQGTLEFQRAHVDLVLTAADLTSKMVESFGGAPAPTDGQLDRIDQQLNRALQGEPLDRSAQDAPQKRAAEAPAGPPVTDGVTGKGGRRKVQADSTIKVSTLRLDALVDMVGELVIAQQMVLQDPHLRAVKSTVLARNLGQVNKITRDLQEASMSLRMVTFRSTFQKVGRLVRDVAQKAGKRVELVLGGAETEVDRNVVERISDPLVHLIRNAIDHGIEAPADRRDVGKPEAGRLELRAYHSAGAIVVEVKDDGRGLDRARILAKAQEKGLLPPGVQADDLGEDDTYRLIFEPGFSTAAAVTDISGRGVGMDVVRKNIEAMRGRIEIRSSPGAGTTFLLRLPLTLAIIDGMVVRVGSQRFVIPTLSIEESFQPSARKVHWDADGGPLVDVRGVLLPVRRLSAIVQEPHDAERDGVIVLMSSGAERFCVLVDEIVGQQQVVIKNLGATVPKIPGVAGGAIMGDGRVALILDAEGVAREVGAASSY